MNVDLIKQFAINNNYYSCKIDYDYIIPRNILTKNNIYINLVDNRNKALLNNESSFSKEFESDLINMIKTKSYGRYLQYIKEFPIIVKDKVLWNNILDGFSVPTDNTDLRDVNYFLIDFYLINFNIAIEIDSIYHKGKGCYDQARDMYLEISYGIKTTRFYNYGEIKDYKIPYLNRLENQILNYNRCINSWNLIRNKFDTDFSDIILDNFIKDNKNALIFIDDLIEYIGGFWQFYNKTTILLTLKDLYNLRPKLFSKKQKKIINGSQEQIFLDNISLIMLQVYNRKLIIN